MFLKCRSSPVVSFINDMILKVWQNSQKEAVSESRFKKVQAAGLFKRDSDTGVFL